MAKKLYVCITQGIAETSLAALKDCATTAAAMGVEVKVNFACGGVELVTKGMQERYADVRRAFEDAREAGARFYVCEPGLLSRNIPRNDLVEGVEVVGAATLVNHALEADQCLTF